MPEEPVPIRAHNLLCLLGFEGCGYSPEFVENMTEIKKFLWSRPDSPVQILDSPDAICRACPNLREKACYLRERFNEDHVKTQDLDVARRLGVEAGKVYAFFDLMERIKDSIAPQDLNSICGGCPWLPSGVCARAVSKLRS